MTIMTFIEEWLKTENEENATGTFADGVFHLTRREDLLMDTARESLRTSYGRDLRAARNLMGLDPAGASAL
ncbi:hypothetical protein [Affinirhizobium pseudoryzae]|uniref:hypothetical protein n=1 Tax=Allorhizobium pseudoryzae TaxID=379684 RepID=UPI0013ED6EB8|nr:hypothetical protein [Allorhizobium pseudoryzae]